ncbi:DegV family protein [Lactococcus termiticola]|uniref:DegV family protein n=1 Tax=Lactococcus termiticola TaxID=2169526 RepID=A0A2R5HGT1_9LACT|nr:DegV family protein [Lactococcus termiticola]GBG97267.1 DegV family protein [Lactococcus termiticola]
MAIKIVTDSSITIEPELIEALDITVVPLSVTIDDVLYSDQDLDLDAFMAKMADSKILPKTSQPPVGVFAEVYENIAGADDDIISIHMTESLSGTVEAARQGSLLSNRKVTVLDSDFTDQALKFQVIAAARLAAEGADKDAILKEIDKVRKNTELFIGFSTLENLVKGGRVSRVQGLLGSLLNVRVVGTLKDRQIDTLLRGRGNKTFSKWLEGKVSEIKASGRKIKAVGISHADGMDFSLKIKEALQGLAEAPISLMKTNKTIATHTGPGAWAVMIQFDEDTTS